MIDIFVIQIYSLGNIIDSLEYIYVYIYALKVIKMTLFYVSFLFANTVYCLIPKEVSTHTMYIMKAEIAFKRKILPIYKKIAFQRYLHTSVIEIR